VIENGTLRIVKEGKAKKFIGEVRQITSWSYAAESGQYVLYAERCVYRRGRRRGLIGGAGIGINRGPGAMVPADRAQSAHGSRLPSNVQSRRRCSASAWAASELRRRRGIPFPQ
jgi:hypothetical protein